MSTVVQFIVDVEIDEDDVEVDEAVVSVDIDIESDYSWTVRKVGE